MLRIVRYKDKAALTLLAFATLQLSQAQNVGIGTNAPAFHNKLQVHNEASFDISIGLTNALTTNAALHGARLRLLNSDLVFINYETSGKIMFANGLGPSTKMVIDSLGNVGIGTTNPQFLMHVRRSTTGGGVYSENFATTGQTEAISGRVYSDQGTAVSGVALDNSNASSTIESGRYGVLGTVGNIGTAVGGFGIGASTALRASNTDVTGYALRTSGRVRLDGIGEGASKVLTSDASGNASWQNLPDGANVWTVNGNDIFRTGGKVGIGSNSALALLDVYSSAASYPIALFENANGFNASHTVQIKGNGSGHKLLITDNSFSANASLQINTNAGNALRIAQTGTGNGLYIDNVSTGSSSGVVSYNTFNIGAPGDYSYGVSAASGNDGSGVVTYVSVNAGVYAVNNNPAGGYGVYARSKGTGGAALMAQYFGSGAGIAAELTNGFLKASGTNKTAFTVTTTAGNTAGNNTAIDYASPAATDVVIVTHNWQGNYMGAIGVYWTGTAWRLFREDLSAMPIGEKFNVMVIKQ